MPSPTALLQGRARRPTVRIRGAGTPGARGCLACSTAVFHEADLGFGLLRPGSVLFDQLEALLLRKSRDLNVSPRRARSTRSTARQWPPAAHLRRARPGAR